MKTPRPDRRQAILLAAEKLFSLQGYNGVSIRQIAEEAGVPLALVGYHFGQKHELFHAIFERWSPTISTRLSLLEMTQNHPWDEGKLTRIVQAFINPVLDMRASAEGEYYATLITQLAVYPVPEADRILRDFFDPLAEAFIEALQATVAHEAPDISRATVAWCYQFSLGALLHHILDTRVERLSQGLNRPNAREAGALLIEFIVHGIRGVVAKAHPPAPVRPKRRPT